MIQNVHHLTTLGVNSFLVKMSGRKTRSSLTYIGGFMNSLGGWSWSDGSKWEYRNWMQGSPRRVNQPNVLALNWNSKFIEQTGLIPKPFLCQQTPLNKMMICIKRCYLDGKDKNGQSFCPDDKATYFAGSGKCYRFYDTNTIHSVAGTSCHNV